MLRNTNPDPCNSLLKDEPLERGIDLKKIHKEYDTYPSIYPLGMITVVDSLIAVQKLVFDERRYTMEELLKALRANWEEYEEMRQDFLNAPKSGNDDDYADARAVKVSTRFEKTISQVKDAWGFSFISDGGTAAGYQTTGLACGATPDGRGAMSHLTDGSRSPMAGADKRGPTATLNSAAKIPFMHTEVFNQRFMPLFLEGENRTLFGQYLREWFEKGTIPHIQFNMLTVGLFVFPQLLGELRRAHPALDVRLTSASDDQCLALIRKGTADLGLLTEPIEDLAFVTQPAFEEALVLVTGTSQPLARRRRVKPHDLRHEAYLVYSPGANVRRLVNELFVREQVEPVIVSESDNTEIIKALVRTGAGIAILPYQAVAGESTESGLAVARVHGVELTRRVAWVYPKTSRVPRAVRAALEAFEQLKPRWRFEP